MHFFFIGACEQQTTTENVNLIYFLPAVSSGHTDFVREFEKDGLKEIITYLIFKVIVTFQ